MHAVPDASNASATLRAPGHGTASPAQPAADVLDAEMHRPSRSPRALRHPVGDSATLTTMGISSPSSRSRRGSAPG